jgi:hypothetical protein
VAALSAVSVSYRYKVERRNRSVAIAAEYDIVESLAASQGISIDRALGSLRNDGLRSVVLTEETAGDLISEGRLAVRYDATEGVRAISPVVTGAPDDMARLVRGNRIRYGAFSAPVAAGANGERFPNLTPGMLRALPLGLDPDAAKHVTTAHLSIIARMGNPIGISRQGVQDTIAWAAELGAKIFLPVGDQVLGRRDAKGDLVQALTDHKMLYASPEFAKIGGDEQMLEAAPDLVVRLHSAQAAELDKLPPDECIDRYARAARERNMRILLLRPIDYAAAQPLYKFSEFTKDVAQKVEKQGGIIGDAHAFDEPNVPKPLFFLIGLSLIPLAWFAGGVLDELFKTKWLARAGVAVGLLVALAAYSQHQRQWAALFGAILLPTVAIFVLDAKAQKSAFLAYTITSLVSLTGGLVVAGLLNSVAYYVVAKEFPGVKLAVFLPIVIAAVYFFKRLTAPGVMNSPMVWRAAMLTLVIVGAAGFMWLRTGNDNPAAVSTWELKVRDILDVLLFVRPRTKAFLVGLPLLYLGVSMLVRYRSLEMPSAARERFAGWTALVVTAGMISQTDIVNTLCHMHTPVALSLTRIGVEFVVGTLIGACLWAGVSKYLATPVEEPT